jgi:hypothetical protein
VALNHSEYAVVSHCTVGHIAIVIVGTLAALPTKQSMMTRDLMLEEREHDELGSDVARGWEWKIVCWRVFELVPYSWCGAPLLRDGRRRACWFFDDFGHLDAFVSVEGSWKNAVGGEDWFLWAYEK